MFYSYSITLNCAELAKIKEGMQQIKQDVVNFQDEVASVRNELADFTEELNAISAEMRGEEIDLCAHQTELGELRHRVAAVETGLFEMRGELKRAADQLSSDRQFLAKHEKRSRDLNDWEDELCDVTARIATLYGQLARSIHGPQCADASEQQNINAMRDKLDCLKQYEAALRAAIQANDNCCMLKRRRLHFV